MESPWTDFACLACELELIEDRRRQVSKLASSLSELNDLQLAWAIFILLGRNIENAMKLQDLIQIALELSKTSAWLFAESARVAGGQLDTLNLLVGGLSQFGTCPDEAAETRFIFALEELRELIASGASKDSLREFFSSAWSRFSSEEICLLNKFACGKLKAPCSKDVLWDALAFIKAIKKERCEAALSGNWQISPMLRFHLWSDAPASVPLPVPFSRFELAGKSPEQSWHDLLSGKASDWVLNWKFQGIEVQLLKIDGKVAIWSQEQELLNDALPELVEDAKQVPDGVILQGDLVLLRESDVLSSELLTEELKKRKAKIVHTSKSDLPAFIAFDLISPDGDELAVDLDARLEKLSASLSRERLLSGGSEKLEQLKLFAPCMLKLSGRLRVAEQIILQSFEQLDEALASCRKLNASGIRLRQRQGSGSLIVPSAPLHSLLVLYSVEKDRTTGLYSRLCFAARHDGRLLPLARLSLSADSEYAALIDEFARNNRLESFGPVCLVKPELAFELLHDGLYEAKRQACGYKMKDARLLSYRPDKQVDDVDTLSACLNAKQFT